MKTISKEQIAYIIAIFLSVGVIIMFYLMLFIEIPHSNKETFSNMSNLIIGAWLSMIGFLTSTFTKKHNEPETSSTSITVETTDKQV